MQPSWKDTKSDDIFFMDPNPAAIKNKLRLLHQLSHGSSLIQRVEQSTCEDAHLLLKSAIESHSEGLRELEHNNLESALEYADQGLRAMAAAAKIVPNKTRETEVEKERYQQMQAHISSLQKTLERVGAKPSPDKHNELYQLIDESERFAGKGDYHFASDRLTRAAVELETILNKSYGSKTIVYELGFDTPEEEYQYEDRRNKEYIMLVELVAQQHAISEKRITVLEKSKQKNDLLRSDAETLANSGSFEAAIKKMEDGTRYLSNALRSAGLAVQ